MRIQLKRLFARKIAVGFCLMAIFQFRSERLRWEIIEIAVRSALANPSMRAISLTSSSTSPNPAFAWFADQKTFGCDLGVPNGKARV
jgi:hypothetical protein